MRKTLMTTTSRRCFWRWTQVFEIAMSHPGDFQSNFLYGDAVEAPLPCGWALT